MLIVSQEAMFYSLYRAKIIIHRQDAVQIFTNSTTPLEDDKGLNSTIHKGVRNRFWNFPDFPTG